MDEAWRGDVVVVGAGLIGTSIGLAARAAGVAVRLLDRDPRRAALAASLGAGEAMDVRDDRPGTLVVVAVAPGHTGSAVVDVLRRGLGATVTHVCSVQSVPQAEVEAAGVPLNRFVGGHPIAGRELSGPVHASADLFRDRPWVLTPTSATDADAVESVARFVRTCGARPVTLTASVHDELFARLSHAPQLVASALASAVADLAPAEAELAGSGFRDTTRLADSDAELWAQIVAANAGPVARALRAVTDRLTATEQALDSGDGARITAVVGDLVRSGRAGRALLPGKHGRRPTALAVVEVVIPDEPGALARLLSAVADQRVNLEDLRVDHAPGQPLGVASLVVAPERQERLAGALRAAGWAVSAGLSEAL